MLSNKIKKTFGNQVKELLRESYDSNNFHNRIHDEIQQSKKQMKDRRDRFQLIRNK